MDVCCPGVQFPFTPLLVIGNYKLLILGRLAYQRGQLSVKQPLLALQVRFLPDLPIMESKPVRQLALFAKQMDEQLWYCLRQRYANESTALRLYGGYR